MPSTSATASGSASWPASKSPGWFPPAGLVGDPGDRLTLGGNHRPGAGNDQQTHGQVMPRSSVAESTFSRIPSDPLTSSQLGRSRITDPVPPLRS